MSKLFEDADSDIEINTDNDFAKSYEPRRKREELHKFKARHGEHALDLENEDEDDEDTSDDDETAVELTQEALKDFYRTLALLKNNDPVIYDDKAVFHKNTSADDKLTPATKKEKKMFVRDYEREQLIKNGGIESDSENNEVNSVHIRRDEERILIDSFKVEDDDSDEDIGSLLKARKQTEEEKIKEEENYEAWLIGQKKELKDEETASSLRPLRDYWCDEKLDDGEKFLRDYFLNKSYLDKEKQNYIPTYNEIVQDLSEDENELDKQEEFEHKYNFRHEEPDPEFIKRYPRTIEGSLRKEDNKRILKRAKDKERKAKEKEEKMNELRKLREIQRKEIEEKIEKLKEITGNKEIAFKDEDIEGDFDPEEHDKRMQALFNEEYYQDGPEEDIKPPIDLDDEDALELQPENYDNWTGPEEEVEHNAPHCEDDGFNMDADYDPKATQKELVEISRRKKKRKRKSKFVEMLAKDRPKFDPMDKSYEKYMDEYYKFDCEDFVDDIPCKFKYRKVAPNSFGLSVEEILLANDRELNKWCSLKKAVSLRDEQVEKYEQKVYEKKGQNIVLKKKIIPSLFLDEEKKEGSAQISKLGKEKADEKVPNLSDSSKSLEKETQLYEVEASCKSEEQKTQKTTKNESVVEKNLDKNESGENSFVSLKKKGKKRKVEEFDGFEKANGDENTNSSSPSILTLENSVEKKKKKSKKKKNPININNEGETPSSQGSEQVEQKNVPKDVKSSEVKRKRTFEEFNGFEKAKGDENKETSSPSISTSENSIEKKKRKSKKMKKPTNCNNEGETSSSQASEQVKQKNVSKDMKALGVKRKPSNTLDVQRPPKKFKKQSKKLDIGISDSRISCFGWNPKKFKNKLIYGNKDDN